MPTIHQINRLRERDPTVLIPLYLQIQAELRDRIVSGRYPVGELLPTEADLCTEFGASRYTVREALRRLTEHGFVRRRQGAGTLVVSTEPTSGYVQSFRTLEELFQSAMETHYVIVTQDEVVLQSDIGGQVVWASPSLSDVLGWDAAEVVGHSLLPLVHPDDRERVNEARRTAVQSGDDSATVTELRYATRDGGWRWMRVHTRRLHDDGGLALGAISAAQDISREIELRERHRSLERYDDLTGLINRDAAVHHLARVLDATKGTGRCAGVLYLDIDDFKRVNDDHGLAVGDELLVAVASHLTSTLRESDVVARMGADEFLVILASVREDWHAITRAQTLRESLADLTVEGLPAFTVSIGVVTDDGDGSAPADIEAAKRAVRRAKLEGRDRIAF